jgi:hypothetical protein
VPSQGVAASHSAYVLGGALVAGNIALGGALAASSKSGAVLALVPVVLVVGAGLIASNRAVLVYAAFALALLEPLPFIKEFNAGPILVYPSDVIVTLAVGSWAAARLVNPDERPKQLRSMVLGWPLALFALALGAAIVHGHLRYGTSLFSLPIRLVAYAGIAFALTDLKVRDAYKWLVALFYVGTAWRTGYAIHGLITGEAQTSAINLSTGGQRVLAGSTAMLMAGAIILGLINLERERRASRMAFHLIVVGLATFSLVVTFQRTTFALVALLVPLFLLAFRTVGAKTAGFLPLAAPFLVLAVLLIPRADPELWPTLRDRLVANPTTDTSVSWRERATRAVWAQVREAPIQGVGFGQQASFTVAGTRTQVGQDPHNQYLYLWAGGGLLLLGSFVLLLVAYLVEYWRRFRSGTRLDRRFVFWSMALWFVFLVNSATGVVLTTPLFLLLFWILMLLPMLVRVGEGRSASP